MENELRPIVDALPGLVWTALPNGHVDFVNRYWSEFTGLTAEASGGTGWQAAVHPDDIGEILADWRVMPESDSLESTVRLRRRDGVYRVFTFRSAPLRDPSGALVKWCGTGTDLDTLVASERNLTQIVNTLPTTAWSTEPDGFCDFLNQRWLDYAGLTAEQARGWGWAVVIHPDDAPGLQDHWLGCLASGAPVDTEARMRGRDGQYRWFLFLANPMRDESGTIVKWYGTNVDIEARKRAEEAVKAKERELFRTVSTIPTPAFSTRPDGYVDFLNQPWLDYAGMTAEQAQGWGWSAMIHPDDVDRQIKHWQSCLDAGVECEIETRHRRYDGVYRWCLVRANPLRDELGNVIKWYGTSFDIEDRKRAEEELREKERDLVRIIDTIPTTAWSTRPDGYTEFLNERWLDYAGFTLEEAQGWGWAAVIHPDDAVALSEYWRGCLDAGTPVDTEARMRGRDGTYRWFLFRANPLRDESGTIVKWYGTNIDIEDRKRADDALRLSRSFLEKGQSISSTGSFFWRLDRNELDVSDEWRRIHEFEFGVPITLDQLRSRIHPEDRAVIEAMIERSRNGSDVLGEVLDYELRLVMPDGSVKFVHTNGHGTRDSNGILEVIGATQDITLRKLAENELLEARAELERVARVTTLGTLTASIAHEVSQPLAVVGVNAGMCLRLLTADPPNVSAAIDAVRGIVLDGKRASDVISRLRALFAKKVGAREELDLNSVAREVVTLASNILQRHRVVLREELAYDLPPVTGDRVELQQVIMNLLLNACDAMRGVEDRKRTIVVRSQRDDAGGVRLSLQDVGVGIELQNEHRLFEPFYSTKDGGMGIGLSISRSIIERHGGRLWATSSEGAGATFSFVLPPRTF